MEKQCGLRNYLKEKKRRKTMILNYVAFIIKGKVRLKLNTMYA